MLYENSSILQMAGQACIATFYLVIGARNLRLRANHVRKFAQLGVPLPGAFLLLGFAFQFGGGLMILLDVFALLGAGLLFVFTVLANLIYHRWWSMGEEAARRIHMNYFFNNVGNLGGLLLVGALHAPR
ncbi:MAG: hypothetical protein JWN93_2126 [Hyphomicrobiales bacterium]|nr:hypothetical protein [Hyphomicrobiales bacterium]